MCGIWVILSRHERDAQSDVNHGRLERRGPDFLGEHTVKLDTETGRSTTDPPLHLSFRSSVLSLRGSGLVSQPLVDSTSGSVLCWNGEAWRIGPEAVVGNDGRAVFHLLLSAASSDDGPTAVVEAIASVAGPHAFVFLDRLHSRLFYGRDRLGRRSLLRQRMSSESLVLSSVSSWPSDQPWVEVEADGVHVLDLQIYFSAKGMTSVRNLTLSFLGINQIVPPPFM